MRKLFALALLFAATLTFAQQGGLWNFATTGPYGPPQPSHTLTLNTLFVNRIDLLPGTSAVIGGANFYAYTTGRDAMLTACIYPDLISGPVWQDSVTFPTVGPMMLSAPQVTMTGTFYWAYVETGSTVTGIAGFFTSSAPAMEMIYNFDTVRYGTSANYAGNGCPSFLGELSPAPSSVNVAAFFLHP